MTSSAAREPGLIDRDLRDRYERDLSERTTGCDQRDRRGTLRRIGCAAHRGDHDGKRHRNDAGDRTPIGHDLAPCERPECLGMRRSSRAR
jgi:hypothetical protein